MQEQINLGNLRELELKPEELREKMKDPNFLPTHKQLVSACMEEFGPGLPLHFSYDSWNELTQNQYQGSYEILNKEFIDSLSTYLQNRILNILEEKKDLVKILEVGAGNGRLTHFLEQELEKKIPGKFSIIATDSGVWKIKQDFPVETLDAIEAVNKVQPDIVIASWMTYPSYDWTPEFQNTESVKEYILIGTSSIADNASKSPDFYRTDIEEVSKTQICKHDDGFNKDDFISESKTVSFKRGKKDKKFTIIKKQE